MFEYLGTVLVDIDPGFGDRAPDCELVNELVGTFIDVEDGISDDQVSELVYAYVCVHSTFDIKEIEWE